MRFWTALLTLALTAACAIEAPEDMEVDADAGGDVSSGSSTTTGLSLSGTSAVTVSGSGPSSGSADDTGGTTGEESATATSGTTDGGDTTGGASVCSPQPTSVGFALALDWNPGEVLFDPIELDVTCTVSGISFLGDEHSLDLACDDGPHTLDVLDLGVLDLGVGTTVTLRAHDYTPWWRQTHILLMQDGEVIIAGMTSGRMPSGEDDPFNPPSTFFEPLGVELLPDVCEPEPPPGEDPEPCNFLCTDPCTRDQRQALRFTIDGQSVDVYDATMGSLAGLEIAVSSARHHVEVLCSDTPNGWYQFLATRTL